MTGDSDLRTKLEALLNRLIETYEAHEQWAKEDNNFGERLLAMNIVGDLTHLRALLAEDSDPSAADG